LVPARCNGIVGELRTPAIARGLIPRSAPITIGPALLIQSAAPI
jgi:hypothetical protein